MTISKLLTNINSIEPIIVLINQNKPVINTYKQFFIVLIMNLFIFMDIPNSWAVVILGSAFNKSGFKPAETLALSPQFASLIFIEDYSSSGSGA